MPLSWLGIEVYISKLICLYFLITIIIFDIFFVCVSGHMCTGIMNLISLFAGFVMLFWSLSLIGMRTKFLVSIVRWGYLQSHSCYAYGGYMYLSISQWLYCELFSNFFCSCLDDLIITFLGACLIKICFPLHVSQPPRPPNPTPPQNELTLMEWLFWSGNK